MAKLNLITDEFRLDYINFRNLNKHLKFPIICWGMPFKYHSMNLYFIGFNKGIRTSHCVAVNQDGERFNIPFSDLRTRCEATNHVFHGFEEPKVDSWLEAKKMNIKIVVDSKEWQELRISFLGKWMKHSDENIEALRAYVKDMTEPLRVRRVLNYLTGTAFRLGKINSPKIEQLRNEVREIWRANTEA